MSIEDEINAVLDASDTSEAEQEFAAIRGMLTLAAEYGMEIEVVRSFGDARAAGEPVAVAAWSALQEWDI